MSLALCTDVETAHSKLMNLQERLRTISGQKRELDRQREELRLETLKLLKAYKPVEKNLIEEADHYAKAWGIEFGNALCAKLPREIRDMIYEELISSPSSITIDPVQDDDNDDPWGTWGLPSWTDTPNPDTWVVRTKGLREKHQHLVCPEYYGLIMGHEIMQSFYRSNEFNVSIGDIGLLLTSDIFQKGHLPLEYIRKVRIHITDTSLLNKWNWRMPSTESEDDWGSFFAPRENVEMTDCPADPWPLQTSKAAILDVLSLVSNKKACEVTLVARTGPHSIKHHLLVNLGGIVFKLRDAGFTVKVVQQSKKKAKKKRAITGSPYYAFPGSDWTSFFDMSREEWRKRVETKTIGVGESRHHFRFRQC